MKQIAAEVLVVKRETWKRGMLMTAVASIGIAAYFALTDSLTAAILAVVATVFAGVYVTFCFVDERGRRAQERYDRARRPSERRPYKSRSSRKSAQKRAYRQ